ncbi:MAG TPA: T9SS type A sorting domain-containing protein, partial [Bacteroidia bacterium]|nr:T9SS type A sorting domain-containing protein [Bacteroidia bacterium]
SATLAGQYKVIETANGCYKTKSAQLAVTSCREEGEGIIANKQSNISISPNPFSDLLNIYAPSEKEGNAEIQVLDMVGKVVYRSVITLNQTSEIKLNVPAGIYFLSVNVDGRHLIQKIVKSR